MKAKDILAALDMAEDEYIEEANPENEGIKKKFARRFKWLKVALPAAACVCVVSISVAVLSMGGDIGTAGYNGSYGDVPVKDYAASDIADMVIEYTSDGDTKYYTEEFFPSDKYLEEHIKDNVPLKENYLPVYEDVRFGKESEEEGEEKGKALFEKYEAVIDRFCEQAEMTYNKEKIDNSDEIALFDIKTGERYDMEKYYVGITRWDDSESVTISHSVSSVSGATDDQRRRYFKNGELTINWNRTDEEIINDTEWLKKDIFEIFGREFTDVAVERECWYETNCLEIVFYNKADARMSYNTVYDDNISLRFKTNGRSADGKMFLVYVDYVDYYKTIEERQKVIAVSETITLSEAEELLAKGYVFCEHVCCDCISQQDAVSFEDYDFVEINYIFRRLKSSQRQGRMEGVPFYTFYKKLSDLDDGTVMYAVTNVCALKLTGYEDYFSQQAQYHR